MLVFLLAIAFTPATQHLLHHSQGSKIRPT
jgi:hypothetical protein